MVAWEDGEQSAAGARQTPPYHGQQQQQDLLLPELWAATQDNCAAVHKHARAAHGDTDHAAISRHEAARAFDSHRSCSPTVHHSTQGYTAQHRPRQVNGAACSPTCQHACAPKPMQRPARDCLKHDSNVGQHIADGSCLHSRTQRTPDMTEVQKGNKTSRRKVCMSPSPERVSKPCTPGKPRPNQAAGGSKVQSSGAAGYRARSSSGHGNVAQAQGSSQQGSQRKRGLSAGPTHMKNWVQWESHQDKVRDMQKASFDFCLS